MAIWRVSLAGLFTGSALCNGKPMRPLLICFAIFFSGCGGPIDRPAREDKTHIVRVNDDEVRTLDPHKVSIVTDGRVVGDLFQGLIDLDVSGRPIPGQAQSWSVSDDGLTWVFILRPDLVWSDATPLSAEDFVYSFRRLVLPATAAPYANLVNGWVGARAILKGEASPETLGVTALDSQTLEIQLIRPEPALLNMLAYAALVPVPRHVIAKHGDAWSRPGTLIGNGAYTLSSWRRQASMEMVKNRRFHAADSVALDRVTYVPISDEMAAVRQFRAGEVDIVPDFPGTMAAVLEQQLGDQVHIGPYLTTFYWVFNTTKPPFDNPAVRRALSMSVDREAIIRSIMRTGNAPAYAMVPPDTGSYGPAYLPDWASWPLEARRAEAKRLLEAVGITPASRLEVVHRYNTSDTYQRIALAIGQMWAELGVDLVLFNSETAVHYAALRSGDYVLGRAGWAADYAAPENFLFVFASASKGLNYPRYRNPRYDELLDAAVSESDVPTRMALMREAEAILIEDSPILPIFYYVSKYLVADDVTGWSPNVLSAHRSRWLGFAP